MSHCEPVHKIVGDIWKAYGPIVVQAGLAFATVAGQPAAAAALVATGKKVAEVSKDLVSFWNANVANNSWATIGPRRLDFGAKLEGQLVGTTGRWYVCPELSTFDKIRLEVWEQDGKAKTEVTFHLMNPATGACRDEGSFLFNDNNDEKKNQSQHVERTISNAIGHVPLIHLDAKSVANTFEYAVRLTGL